MSSPFPGMNPFLDQEDVWEDFHGRMIPALAERLEQAVGPNYIVKIEPRLYIHELSDEQRHFLGRADVGLAPRGERAPDASLALADAPLLLWLPAVDVFTEHYVEIRDRRDRRLVAVLELLSPTNKTNGPNRDQYLAKRRELLGSTTHFVEIDLRRGGLRPRLDDLPMCDYYVMVSRYRDRPRVGVWPISLRDPLPTVSIPLADPDDAVRLDLQAALQQVYVAANYGKYIYEGQPQPPLSAGDSEWAKQVLQLR